MCDEVVTCTVDEHERCVVSAIVCDGGGQRIPYGDGNTVLDFFPGATQLDEAVLDAIQEGIRLRCWCDSFPPVDDTSTIRLLKRTVSYQHRIQGGPRRQEGSPEQCCS